MVDIILSIRPEYAEKILEGLKRFEFRKQSPRLHVNQVFIYASSPTKRIVGKFRINEIIRGTPEEIWERCGDDGGIERERFFSYFEDRPIGYGFEIDEVERFDPSIDPREINSNFKAPQSFAYLNNFDEIRLDEY